MPKKTPKKAGPPRSRPWIAEEEVILRAEFPTHATRDLAAKLGRSVKSVGYKAEQLGLTKTASHRSAQSRKSWIACDFSAEHMSTIGRTGGLSGGPARADALTKAQRSKAARKAVLARWSNKNNIK